MLNTSNNQLIGKFVWTVYSELNCSASQLYKPHSLVMTIFSCTYIATCNYYDASAQPYRTVVTSAEREKVLTAYKTASKHWYGNSGVLLLHCTYLSLHFCSGLNRAPTWHSPSYDLFSTVVSQGENLYELCQTKRCKMVAIYVIFIPVSLLHINVHIDNKTDKAVSLDWYTVIYTLIAGGKEAKGSNCL